MADLQPAPAESKETALHHGRLGVIGIVFFVVAAAAPLVGMTGAVPVAIVVGNGAAAPGAYVVRRPRPAAVQRRLRRHGPPRHQRRCLLRLRRTRHGHRSRRRLGVRLAGGLHRDPARHLRLLRCGRRRHHERAVRRRLALVRLDAHRLGPRPRPVAGQRRRRRQGARRPDGPGAAVACSSSASPSSSTAADPRASTWRPPSRRATSSSGGFAGAVGHRLRVRLRVLHRLRGDRHLRRGGEGRRTAPFRVATYVAVITITMHLRRDVVGHGLRPRAVGRGRQRWSRSPRVDGTPLADPAAVLFAVADRVRRLMARHGHELAGDLAACSPACSPSRTPPPATSSRWVAPACCRSASTASTGQARRSAPRSPPRSSRCSSSCGSSSRSSTRC